MEKKRELISLVASWSKSCSVLGVTVVTEFIFAEAPESVGLRCVSWVCVSTSLGLCHGWRRGGV